LTSLEVARYRGSDLPATRAKRDKKESIVAFTHAREPDEEEDVDFDRSRTTRQFAED